MIEAKANENEMALAIGISTKAAYHLMQRINECSQTKINPFRLKVSHVMTESTRTVLKVIQKVITFHDVMENISEVITDMNSDVNYEAFYTNMGIYLLKKELFKN